jgi:YesN/AraC family two-component response regulator
MRKILIVDDENLIRFSISSIFKDGETEVRTAANGGEALTAIGGSCFDLCFLDINLPDANGLDIMKKIREISPGTRIIVMTGGDVTNGMMRSIQENAHLLLTKPFDLYYIKTFVDQVLAQGDSFTRQENTVLKEDTSFIKWLANNCRKHERRPAARCITYVKVAPPDERADGSLTAHVLDISDAGMCIQTDCRLTPGHVLKFLDNTSPSMGVVRWILSTGSEEAYRAGIQFVASGTTPQ